MTCNCGTDQPYESCCGPFIAGTAHPPTAEALMRSRYTAFCRGEVDYIVGTYAPETRSEVSRSETENWASHSRWLGLTIIETSGGGPEDQEGTVEFLARYERSGQEIDHHELAQFRRHEGNWVFVDGAPPKLKPIRREGPKVKRGDPCPCGSGRKYKKCCGAN